MSKSAGYWVDLRGIAFDDVQGDSTMTWIQALPLGTYDHPVYGEMDITSDRVTQFATNVNNRVRTTDLDIDYDHKEYGGEAAGWIKEASARSDGLWILVEWTKKAFSLIKDKSYRYFSPEFTDEWTHPKTGEVFQDVLFGGGITNRPFLKDILPINMSEIFDKKLVEGGKSMDPEQLAQVAALLNLPKDATGDQILGALQVTLKVPGNKDPNDPANPDSGSAPKQEAPKDPMKQAHEGDESDDTELGENLEEQLRQLSEKNPSIKALTDIMAKQTKKLAEQEAAIKLAEVGSAVTKLSDKVKAAGFHLTPVVEDSLRNILLNSNKKLSENVMQFADTLVDAKLVQAGEKGGSRTEADIDSPIKKFSDAVSTKMKNVAGMQYGDAVVAVAQEDPNLFEEYRVASSNRD